MVESAMTTEQTTNIVSLSGKSAQRFVVTMGVVAALGDFTYEGARSISTPYLGLLGASAAAIGMVAGLGEFVGYALRVAGSSIAGVLDGHSLVGLMAFSSAAPLAGALLLFGTSRRARQ